MHRYDLARMPNCFLGIFFAGGSLPSALEFFLFTGGVWKKYDKHLIVLRNAEKIHQKRLQTYHDLIVNNKKQDRNLHTAHDWTNYFILSKVKDEPALPRGNSSDVKPKMI